MAEFGMPPHFHNQPGAPSVRVGVREFMCIGALPPFDHPHVYIDMGDSEDTVCEYCSTRYVFDAALHGDASIPPGCAYTPEDAAAHEV